MCIGAMVRACCVAIAAIAALSGRGAVAAAADGPDPKPSPVAKAAAAETKTPPPIVITGSRIPRPNLTAVSPLTVVTSEEVKLEGATNAEELLNNLPQVNPSQGLFVVNGSNGTATVDLRGLGDSRTLVLINGRRLMPGDPGTPVPDINVVPTSLIKRVEVVTGGAAAVYGSDAIAGVVNFILDTDLNGFRIDGQASVFQHDNDNLADQKLLEQAGFTVPHGNVIDGARKTVDVAYGRKFLDGRGHITIYAGYRQVSDLRQDTRDYSACTLGTVPRNLDALRCGGSYVSFPANFFDNLNNSYVLGPNQTFVPGTIFYNYGPWNFWQRPDKRYTAGGFANVELSNAAKPYFEAMYMSDRSVAQVAPSGDFANTDTINCDNPLLSDQQRSLICTNGNFVGQTAILDDNGNLLGIQGSPQSFTDPATGKTYNEAWLAVGRRNAEGGPRQDDFRHESIRLLGGLTGDLGRGITYDASYLFGRVSASDTHLADFSITRMLRALDVVTNPANGQPVCRSVLTGEDPACVPWDIFKADGVTPDALAYLQEPSTISGSYQQQLGTAYVNIDTAQWGLASPWSDQNPILNVGLDYRRDTLDYEPDALAQSGDLAGSPTPIFPVHGSIETKEIFGEARIPLITDRFVHSLTFEGGYRQSWYNNGTNGFSTSAYKLALDLSPISGLRVRASQQRAVRAPNLQELFTPSTPDFFDNDPCAGPTPSASESQCALAGVSASQYGHVLLLSTVLVGYNSIDGGNPSLRPEAATTRTLGLVLQPRFLRGFNATIDWWNIDLKGAIQQIGAQTIVDTCIATGDPLFCDRIHRDPNGSLWLGNGYVDNRLANIAAFNVQGIDLEANYVRSLGHLGSLSANFLATYVDKWIIDFGGLSKPFNCAGLYGDPCGAPQPRWRHTARLTWSSNAGTMLSLHWRYMGGMRIAALDPKFGLVQFVSPLETHLRPESYFDLTATLKVKRHYEFRVGVNNLFDREPPRILVTTPGGAGPLNGNTYPEWYDPLGRYIFVGLTVDLGGH